MKVTINVTEEDIKQGEKQHCSRCPVALALRRVAKGEPAVIGYSIIFSKDIEIETPDDVVEWIMDFDDDDGCDVSPFSFEMDLPEEVVK
jgi:hypothetical protein